MSASRRAGGTKSPPMRTDLDDWETDPDFVRDMDETDQRWGAKRTVGSINMNELIDEVRKDHKIMREKFVHPSQRDHSEGFGGKFGVQHDRKDQSAQDYDYHEELSKHTSQEISRKVITSSSGNGINDAKRTFLERKEDSFQRSRPQLGPKPAEFKSTFSSSSFKPSGPTANKTTTTTTTSTNLGDRFPSSSTSPKSFEESSSVKRIFSEKSSSSSSSAKGPGDLPPAFKSIQEKIDAFKKEFEDIENKVNKKSDLSKVIKKSTNVEKSSNVEYVSRNDSTSPKSSFITPTGRPTSTSPNAAPSTSSSSSSRLYSQKADLPKANIKSLSEKFETLCREDGEDFRRRTEAKRKEFFNEIKNQVRETRKELDGFDPIDEDYDQIIERKVREKLQSRASPTSPLSRGSPGSGIGATNSASRFTATPSPSSRSSSRLGGDLDGSQLSQSSSSKPKVYTKRETTQEKYVSKFVKEGDKVIVDETQRKVERSSSVHGSSDDEGQEEPSSIKFIERELRSSPVARTESPVERLKREIPIVEPEIKGGGLMARTLYDYQAAEEDELSFDVDDLITNIEKIDAGWYKGTIVYKDGRKKIGLFPANYVRLLNDTSEY